MLEEKDIQNYALQVIRFLCQYDKENFSINEIYKNSGVNIHLDRDNILKTYNNNIIIEEHT